METGIIMISVPLDVFKDGITAIARIEVLKAFTVKCSYSVSREDIASILGFELPVKKQSDSGEF